MWLYVSIRLNITFDVIIKQEINICRECVLYKVGPILNIMGRFDI